MVRVKICGITTVADALAVVKLGADAIGLVFAKSPRQVTLDAARRISQVVGPWVSVVGVFVDAPAKKVLKTARDCGLSVVQLHGKETAQDAAKLAGLKVIKVFLVEGHFNASDLKAYQSVGAFHFDAKVGDKIGGTGNTFDWKRLKNIQIQKAVIISGGLHPGNVKQAVRFFNPYGVDVSSGVEKSPGKKDLKLVREFIQNAKKV